MTTTTRSATPAATRPRRLGRNGRRAALIVHILSAGAWVGIDVVLGVLVVTAWVTGDPGTAGVAYQAIGLFAVGPMLSAALVCLASGVVLGLGTRYGLLRYWWVAAKLALNLALTAAILLALRPGVGDVVAHGRALAAGRPSPVDVSFLFFPPAVSLTALTVATVLSVAKPWGRVRATTGA